MIFMRKKMSSNNCERISPGQRDSDESDVQRREKRVCFICGSYTTLIINIHEPRCGPNMIDVISEKFKMRPLNDDKFLCYSCNNWLINWYSMQKKNDDSNHEDVQTTSSTMSATIANKTSGNRCDNDDDLVVISSDDDDENNAENDENIDVNNIIQTLRDRLKKYLYYPNRRKSNDSDFPQSTVIELDRPVSPDTTTTTPTVEACRHCGKSITRNLNPQRICRKCKFSQMQRCGKLTTYRLSRSIKRTKRTHQQRNIHKKDPSTALNRHNIFEKLKQLGTSIYYENDCKGKTELLQQEQQQRNHKRVTLISNEIDTNDVDDEMNGLQRRCTNESNEILMTFNTVVTEVFPMELLYNYACDDQQQIHDTNDTHHSNINDILKNVPKSLTITII